MKTSPLQAIYFALITSIGIYAYIPFFMEMPFTGLHLPNLNDQIVLIVTILAFVMLVAAAIVPKTLARNISKQSTQPAEEHAPEQLAKMAATPFIVRWALIESVTIYGLVLTMLKKDPSFVLIFASVSIVGFLFSYPGREKIKALFSNVS